MAGRVLGIAGRAGLVNFLAGKADVRGGSKVGACDLASDTAMPCHLSTFLRRVVFVGEAALCEGFDLKCVWHGRSTGRASWTHAREGLPWRAWCGNLRCRSEMKRPREVLAAVRVKIDCL
jgi:hypothetical protein